MPDQQTIQQLLTEATALYHSGGYRQAIDIWQQVLASEPNNQRAREGIRMASLLLEESQSAARVSSAGPETAPEASESAETIAQVREGIQKAREFIAASKHLEAMEVCKSLLALAPGSAAVHEVLDEAREAFESHPYIEEHLGIARQLFVQERLDEASAELHKAFFLNPNHAEARKLEQKILALRQKRISGILPSAASPAPPAPEPAPQKVKETAQAPADSPAGNQRSQPAPDFGDSVDLPQEPPPEEEVAPADESSPSPAPGEESVLNENWEAELAQLSLKAPSSPPAARAQSAEAAPPEIQGERLEIVNLSESPGQAAVPKSGDPAPAEEAAEPQKRSGHDLDLSGLVVDEEPDSGAEKESGKRPVAVKWPAGASRRARGGSVIRLILPLLGVIIGGGAAWWYFGLQPSSSGDGGNPSSSPQLQSTRGAGAPGTGPGGANVGLTSSGTRGSSGTASAGLNLPGQSETLPTTPPPPSKEQVRQEIARHFDDGRSLMQRGKYQDAVDSFSKILDLDPANLEAKGQMDEAASKVLEQKRLEEDLQTAKEFFVEKDYESALRKFYRLPLDRNLGELDLFIRNAWYNWALVSLKGGNCPEALQHLQEALTVDPQDADAAKQQEVAEHYKDRPKDRVFYAYTERLTFRTLNQK